MEDYLIIISFKDNIGCYVPGQCLEADLVSILLDIPNISECLESCKDSAECRQFTFDPDSGFCALWVHFWST